MTSPIFPSLTIVNCLILVVAGHHWYHTRRRGFAWIAGAFLIATVHPYGIGLIHAQGNPTFTGSFILNTTPFVHVAYIVCLLAALSDFARNDAETTASDRPSILRLPADWPTFRRRAIGVVGAGLIVAGLVTSIRGLMSLAQRSGELADLGAGPGAILVGAMCLFIGFHRRSPLRNVETGDRD